MRVRVGVKVRVRVRVRSTLGVRELHVARVGSRSRHAMSHTCVSTGTTDSWSREKSATQSATFDEGEGEGEGER